MKTKLSGIEWRRILTFVVVFIATSFLWKYGGFFVRKLFMLSAACAQTLQIVLRFRLINKTIEEAKELVAYGDSLVEDMKCNKAELKWINTQSSDYRVTADRIEGDRANLFLNNQKLADLNKKIKGQQDRVGIDMIVFVILWTICFAYWSA